MHGAHPGHLAFNSPTSPLSLLLLLLLLPLSSSLLRFRSFSLSHVFERTRGFRRIPPSFIRECLCPAASVSVYLTGYRPHPLAIFRLVRR